MYHPKSKVSPRFKFDLNKYSPYIIGILFLLLIYFVINNYDNNETISTLQYPVSNVHNNNRVMDDNVYNKQQHIVNGNDISLLYSLADTNTPIAEEQYWFQRSKELTNNQYIFSKYKSNFPCYWGEAFVESKQSYGSELLNPNSSDGGKWICGLKYIQSPCVIYSVGSHNNWKFEYGLNDELHDLNNNCNIYTFDPFNGPTDNDILHLSSNIIFYPWGAADYNDDNEKMYKLNKIMKKLNHSHIDILKLDIEGWEFPTFYILDIMKEWPSIGQILIEIHPIPMSDKQYKKSFGEFKQQSEKIGKLIELLEKHNFRMFHDEPNPYHLNSLSEYSFIQKNWRPHIKRYA